MKNEQVFKLKETLASMEKTVIADVPFAMKLVDLEIAVDAEVTKLQAIVKKIGGFTEEDAPLQQAKQQIYEIATNPTLSPTQITEQITEINGKFKKEDIEAFNSKEQKVNEFLKLTTKTKFPLLDKTKLPAGLSLASYRILHLVSK